MKEYINQNRKEIQDHQIEVIPNWYEDKGISLVINRSSNKMFSSIKKEGNFIISYFGNMGICQDIETILGAIRLLKDNRKIQFLFAGHGNKMEALKETIKNDKFENVHIFNFLHGQDYQDALNISDCFIVSLAQGLTGLAVPSKTYAYMMSGKPVIAIMGEGSDIARDLTENNAGYSLDVGEISKLVTAINELYLDKNRRDQMGSNCRKVYLQKYTKDICTKQYVDMMHKILEEN
jgi:glycosyltransferase involved in cell wall biosynthesis